MDPASFAFATISVVQNLVQAYSTVARLLHDVKSFDGDREHLIARIRAEEAITICLQSLLFTSPDESSTTLPFEQLDVTAQQSLYAIFALFDKAVENHLLLDRRYGLSGQTPEIQSTATA